MRLQPPTLGLLVAAAAAACVPSADYATGGDDAGFGVSPSPWPPPDGAPEPPDGPVSTATPPATTATVAASAGTTLFVAEALVDCQGEGPMKCMRVRAADDQPWSLHYDRIEGFTYEPGFVYELRVERRDVAKPAADAPSSRLRLLEVVSKRKVGAAPRAQAPSWPPECARGVTRPRPRDCSHQPPPSRSPRSAANCGESPRTRAGMQVRCDIGDLELVGPSDPGYLFEPCVPDGATAWP